jgi:hypothetical protein
MARYTYTVTFPGGHVVTRSSDNVYAYVWMVQGTNRHGEAFQRSGFAYRDDSAHKAADSYLRICVETEARTKHVVKITADMVRDRKSA